MGLIVTLDQKRSEPMSAQGMTATLIATRLAEALKADGLADSIVFTGETAKLVNELATVLCDGAMHLKPTMDAEGNFDISKRRGYVTIDRQFMMDCLQKQMLNPLNWFFVTQIEANMFTDRAKYYGHHMAFDKVTQGEIVPEYRMVFTAGETAPVFERVT